MTDNITGAQAFALAILNNPNSPVSETLYTFSGAGNNTVTVPPLSGGMIIIPPIGNTQALILKGVNGDTGMPLHLTAWYAQAFPVAGPPANFVINVSGTVTNLKIIWT
jgi:hypothetical protein